MMRLLLLLLLLYLLWRFYRRVVARGRRVAPALPAARLRLEPLPTAFPIHHVSSAAGESFLQLNPELPIPGTAAPLAVLEHGSESAAGGTYLVGSVQNTGERTLAEVDVQLGLYGRADELLGSLTAARDSLAPGHVWSYRVKVTQGGANSYRVLALCGIYARESVRAR
ncbi:hypothetical protein BH24DEI1_BH24DEI1_15560 [soil metagenome]